jgi:hypothetical protein
VTIYLLGFADDIWASAFYILEGQRLMLMLQSLRNGAFWPGYRQYASMQDRNWPSSTGLETRLCSLYAYQGRHRLGAGSKTESAIA